MSRALQGWQRISLPSPAATGLSRHGLKGSKLSTACDSDTSVRPLTLQADYNLSLVEYELVSIAGVGASGAAANSAVTAEA